MYVGVSPQKTVYILGKDNTLVHSGIMPPGPIAQSTMIFSFSKNPSVQAWEHQRIIAL